MEAIYHNDEDRFREHQKAAWKTFIMHCQNNHIDAIRLANILGISEGRALQFLRQGAIKLKMTDEQYERFGRATKRTAHFWKTLFEGQ